MLKLAAIRDASRRSMVIRAKKGLARGVPRTSRLAKLLPLAAFIPFEMFVPGTSMAALPIANFIANKTRTSSKPVLRGLFEGVKPVRVLGNKVKRKLKRAISILRKKLKR